MSRFVLFGVIITVLAVFTINNATAQTNPSVFDLNSGNYAFTDWLSTAPAGTYPPNMAFHMVGSIDSPADAVATADWNCAYSLTSGARINGTGTTGLTLINTGTLVCNCAFIGSAVLALNTTNRTQINVSYVAATTLAGQRQYGLRLQYRLSTVASWTNVINNGAFVEFLNTPNVTSPATTITSPLPTVCENQPLVQLRWVYYYVAGSGTGSRPAIRLDDISVTSNSVVGTPTNLLVQSNSPVTPSQNTSFSVLVRSADALGVAKNVTTATTVQLSLNTGTGTLSGTLTGVIPAGQNSVLLTNVVYNTAQAGVSVRATATVGMALTLSNGNAFTVSAPAAYAITSNAQTTGYATVPFNPLTISIFKADNTLDNNYASVITVTKVSGPGNVSGTSSLAAFQGIAVFDNLTVDAPGSYQLQVNIPGLPTQTLPFNTAFATPLLTTDIVPQFIQSRVASGTCNSSVSAFPVPVYARVTFTGLQPNTMYRYNSGLATDANLTSTGGGFNIHYNANGNSYSYVGGKNLITNGEYSAFSTGASETTKSVWINLVASTNADFQEGNIINWRISLGDNLGQFIRRFQLSQTSQVIRLGTSPTQATGIADDNSQLTPKNYVLLYDNTTGTGRPLAVAIVQGHGTAVSGAESFYASRENRNSAWATFIPNTLANGVRRIEERDFRTNAIVYSITSATGLWNGVQTNPSNTISYPSGPGGFSNPIILETPRITLTSPKTGDTLCAAITADVTFTARGVNTVRVEFSSNNGASWDLMGDFPSQPGVARITIPALEFAGQARVRVTGVERTDIFALSTPFSVASRVVMLNKPYSKNLCLGETHSLLALTSGAVRAYQWYKNNEVIPNANGPLYSITDANYGTSGRYYCVVWGFGQCGSTVSDTAHLRVARQTSVSAVTVSVPAQLGAKAVLIVDAEVPGDVISYQWYRGQAMMSDNSRIQGTRSNRLEFARIVQGDFGADYYCVAVGVCGSATSKMMRITTNALFVEFTSKEVSACHGGTVTLAGMAYANPATATVLLRWWHNSQPIFDGGQYSGATTSRLTITGVSASHTGTYTLRAELADNPLITAEESINVVIASPPTITQQPVSQDVCEGYRLTLSIGATAQGTMQIEWMKDGAVIPGENASTYTIANVTRARAGSYTCRVFTACGQELSRAAFITVSDPTVITQQPPASTDVQVGLPFTLTITATGTGTIQYQWFKDGNQIAGEVTPDFTVAAAALTDAGKYWCRVRSDCGELLSNTAVVMARPGVVGVAGETLFGGLVVGRISPNPSVDNTSIALFLPTDSKISVSLIDATGSVMFIHQHLSQPSGHQTLPLDVSGITTGVYQVLTDVNGVRVSQTLVVTR